MTTLLESVASPIMNGSHQKTRGTIYKDKVRQFLVVIDNDCAKNYRTELRGATPVILIPYYPNGLSRTLSSVPEETAVISQTERKSFYDGVAKKLEAADRIFLFGCGTDESNAVEQFIDELQLNHADTAKRIIGAVVVDPSRQPESKLPGVASEFDSTNGV